MLLLWLLSLSLQVFLSVILLMLCSLKASDSASSSTTASSSPPAQVPVCPVPDLEPLSQGSNFLNTSCWLQMLHLCLCLLAFSQSSLPFLPSLWLCPPCSCSNASPLAFLSVSSSLSVCYSSDVFSQGFRRCFLLCCCFQLYTSSSSCMTSSRPGTSISRPQFLDDKLQTQDSSSSSVSSCIFSNISSFSS